MARPQDRKRRWTRRIERIHGALLHAEAVAECMGDLATMATTASRAEADGTAFIREVFAKMWGQWSAIALRAICRGGPIRHRRKNVSLETLLDDLSVDVEAFLKVASRSAVTQWIGPSATPEAARRRLVRDKEAILRVSAGVKDFGDIIAHLHLRARRLNGRRLRICRERARQVVDQYHRLIVGRAPDMARRDEFVERFMDGVDHLFRFADTAV
jgi:hypothetical protein